MVKKQLFFSNKLTRIGLRMRNIKKIVNLTPLLKIINHWMKKCHRYIIPKIRIFLVMSTIIYYDWLLKKKCKSCWISFFQRFYHLKDFFWWSLHFRFSFDPKIVDFVWNSSNAKSNLTDLEIKNIFHNLIFLILLNYIFVSSKWYI